MRFGILVLLVLAACAPVDSGGQLKSLKPERSLEQKSLKAIPSAPAGVHQEPVTVTGTGIQKSAPFHLEAGTYLVTWTATPSNAQGCYHGASLQSTNPDTPIFELLANELLDSGAPKSGQTFIYNLDAGDYYVDASSGCAWSFTFTQQ